MSEGGAAGRTRWHRWLAWRPEPSFEHIRLVGVVLAPLAFPFILVAVQDVDAPTGQLLVAAVLQSTLLCFARRWPVAVPVAVMVIESVTALVVGAAPILGLIAAVYLLALHCDRVPSIIGLLVGVSSLAAHSIMIRKPSSWSTMVVVALFVVGPWVIGRLEHAQRGRITELHDRSEHWERERAEAERAAAERERALLARELHDILNHSVTAMVLDSEAGAETGDERTARATLRRVADTGRSSLAELRRLLGVLRATSQTNPHTPAGPGSAHQPIAPPPTLAQLDDLVAAIPDTGPRVALDRVGDVRPLDTSIELAGYRIVQESLTNATKHAGAVQVAVCLRYLPDRLEIRVHNPLPAHRATAGSPGTGLIGMHERAELLGGTLTAGPDQDGGFTVKATLPLGTNR